MTLIKSVEWYSGRVRGWRCVARWLSAVFALMAVGAGAVEADAVREFEVKAVFLFNFARFVEWPGDAFADGAEPLVIGVLGADPFGRFLDETLRHQKVSGRRLVVRRYDRVADISKCHILFISGSEWADVEGIIQRLRDQPILTVCDTDLIARSGTMVQLVNDEGHVRLRINLEAARRARLALSAKLLRSAEIVSSGSGGP